MNPAAVEIAQGIVTGRSRRDAFDNFDPAAVPERARRIAQVSEARALVDLAKRSVRVVDDDHVELIAVERQRAPFDAMRLDQRADLRADAAGALGLFVVERGHAPPCR